jgi:hypothetical protein
MFFFIVFFPLPQVAEWGDGEGGYGTVSNMPKITSEGLLEGRQYDV